MALVLFLLLILLPTCLVLSLCSLLFYTSGDIDGVHVPVSPLRWLFAFLLPMYIVHRALLKKNLDVTGAAAALVVGFILTVSNYCFCACLLAFFLSASKATKYRADLKAKLEEDHEKGSERNWIQVICNGGVATQMAIIFMMEAGCREFLIDFSHNYTISWLCMSVLGALAAASGDTYASELGTVIGTANPRLITSFQSVPKGTNGGISLCGTFMSFLGGAVIGLAYYLCLLLCTSSHALMEGPPQWPIIFVGGLAGLIGSTIDSVLGAWFQFSGYDTERRRVVNYPGPHVEHICGVQCLDNHSVNLITSFIMSMMTPSIALLFWGQIS